MTSCERAPCFTSIRKGRNPGLEIQTALHSLFRNKVTQTNLLTEPDQVCQASEESGSSSPCCNEQKQINCNDGMFYHSLCFAQEPVAQQRCTTHARAKALYRGSQQSRQCSQWDSKQGSMLPAALLVYSHSTPAILNTHRSINQILKFHKGAIDFISQTVHHITYYFKGKPLNSFSVVSRLSRDKPDLGHFYYSSPWMRETLLTRISEMPHQVTLTIPNFLLDVECVELHQDFCHGNRLKQPSARKQYWPHQHFLPFFCPNQQQLHPCNSVSENTEVFKRSRHQKIYLFVAKPQPDTIKTILLQTSHVETRSLSDKI